MPSIEPNGLLQNALRVSITSNNSLQNSVSSNKFTSQKQSSFERKYIDGYEPKDLSYNAHEYIGQRDLDIVRELLKPIDEHLGLVLH
jgi:hypothetical protein